MADPILVTRLQSACAAVLADGGTGGAHNDVFLVELAIDPASGTLALVTYGLCSPGNGTQAAAWYWANVMLPNRSTYTDSWYLYEWTDTNGERRAGSDGHVHAALQRSVRGGLTASRGRGSSRRCA